MSLWMRRRVLPCFQPAAIRGVSTHHVQRCGIQRSWRNRSALSVWCVLEFNFARTHQTNEIINVIVGVWKFVWFTFWRPRLRDTMPLQLNGHPFYCVFQCCTAHTFTVSILHHHLLSVVPWQVPEQVWTRSELSSAGGHAPAGKRTVATHLGKGCCGTPVHALASETTE